MKSSLNLSITVRKHFDLSYHETFTLMLHKEKSKSCCEWGKNSICRFMTETGKKIHRFAWREVQKSSRHFLTRTFLYSVKLRTACLWSEPLQFRTTEAFRGWFGQVSTLSLELILSAGERNAINYKRLWESSCHLAFTRWLSALSGSRPLSQLDSVKNTV